MRALGFLFVVAGFLAVPLFKFAAPPLLSAAGWPEGNEYLTYYFQPAAS